MSLPLPDDAAALAATERLRLLDVPGIGLGALTGPVSFVAGVQATETTQAFDAVRVLLLHGAHEGAVAAGESSMDWDARLRQAQRGEGPLSLLAGRAGATLQIIDTGSAPEFGAARPIDSADAMPEEAVDEALGYGWRIATEAVEQGMDLLVLAAAGPGQQAVASALVASITGRESPALLGRVVVPGGGIDDNAWMLRCAAVRDALHRIHGPREPKRLLAALGGPDFAVAAGLLLGAAAGRVPVVIDGPVGAAAALVAHELATQSRLWMLVLDESEDPAARAAVTALSLKPLVKLGLGLGEGTNALAVLPLVQAALALSTLDTAPPVDFDDAAPDIDDARPAKIDEAPPADREDAPQEEPETEPPAEPDTQPEAEPEARPDAAAGAGRAGDPDVA
jgi:nicotinate-nucleotide--dimethylbenzimidazole phosphoribosyltransferase